MQSTARRIWRILYTKVEQAYRLFYLHFLTWLFPTVVVVEYPKSGGTWTGQLISNYLGIPFPRNRMFLPGYRLLHGPYRPGSWVKHTRATIWLVRDGRDVMVSHYYHSLQWNDKNMLSPMVVLRTRRHVPFEDYDNMRGNLPAFIRHSHEFRPSRLENFTFMGSWTDFQDSWMNAAEKNPNHVTQTSYEALSADTAKELERILVASGLVKTPDSDKIREIVDRFSFEKQSGRKRGEMNTKSFLRKGMPGDWVNQFTREAGRVWEEVSGDTMRKLGQEKDEKWYEKLPVE